MYKQNTRSLLSDSASRRLIHTSSSISQKRIGPLRFLWVGAENFNENQDDKGWGANFSTLKWRFRRIRLMRRKFNILVTA